jgi:hypothetical protein
VEPFQVAIFGEDDIVEDKVGNLFDVLEDLCGDAIY